MSFKNYGNVNVNCLKVCLFLNLLLFLQKQLFPFSISIQPEIKTSLRRKSKKISHLPIGKNEDLQHVSSASCCSSMQVLFGLNEKNNNVLYLFVYL